MMYWAWGCTEHKLLVMRFHLGCYMWCWVHMRSTCPLDVVFPLQEIEKAKKGDFLTSGKMCKSVLLHLGKGGDGHVCI